MNEAVIDTNVLLVANGAHESVSNECRKACIEFLLSQQQQGVVVIDDAYRIIKEYQKKTHPNEPRKVGDAFLKWLLQNRTNSQRVHQVRLTETKPDKFSEFPGVELQETFDPPDRKFAAVAHAHQNRPPILQATDCKWLNWWKPLAEAGVRVEFICPNQIREFYAEKFPHAPIPDLPAGHP